MPQCGGEHVFSYRAMGSTGSFICTWMIVLGYVSVACFEACAFPTIITYLWPGFLKGYMYTVAGFDIYASWLITAIVIAFLIMMINIIGAKTAAILQTVLTCDHRWRRNLTDRCISDQWRQLTIWMDRLFAGDYNRCEYQSNHRSCGNVTVLTSLDLMLSRRQQRRSMYRRKRLVMIMILSVVLAVSILCIGYHCCWIML